MLINDAITDLKFIALGKLDGAEMAGLDDTIKAYWAGRVESFEELERLLKTDTFQSVDYLTDLLKKQDLLQQKVGTTYDVPFAKDMSLALIDEICESLHEIPSKNWSKKHLAMRAEGKNYIDHEAYKLELVDALHFILNLFIFAGMSAKDIWDGYNKKNAINHERQNTGY
jgi:dimeric dUTPase (all-alpha-NTP-PPase superfamily)